MAETGFDNKFSLPEISRIRKNRADIPVYHRIFRFLSQHETDVDSPVYHNHIRNSDWKAFLRGVNVLHAKFSYVQCL